MYNKDLLVTGANIYGSKILELTGANYLNFAIKKCLEDAYGFFTTLPIRYLF